MIALVAALAGSAAALPGKNKVDKNDIKKNAVKSKAIAKGAVKSSDIKDGQVGEVDLTPDEAFHRVGAPGEPAFGNGGENDCLWSSITVLPGANPTGFYRDARGIVRLIGLPLAQDGPGGDGVCGNDAQDLVIFEMPPGYRPQNLEVFPSGNPDIQLNLVAPDSGLTLGPSSLSSGAVAVTTITDGSATTLDGNSFRAAGPGTAPIDTANAEVKLGQLRRALK